MKKLVFNISALMFMALVVIVMAACTSKNKAVVVDSEEEVVDDDELLADDDNDDLLCDELSLRDVLLMLHQYDYPQKVQTTGLALLYKAEDQSGEVDCIEYVYGHDVEKGAKQEFGYELEPSSNHGCYFRIGLDTSISACLCFANASDAKRFLKRLSEADPTDFDGKTFYVNKKTDEQSLYIDTKYDDDYFNTSFLVYPPSEEDGFYKLQIDFWM